MLLWCPKCPGTWSRPSCDLRVTRTLPGCNSRLGIFARRKPPRRLLRLTRARRLRWTRGIETSTLRFLFHLRSLRVPFSIPIAATATQQRRFLAVLSVVVVVLVRTTTERSTHTYYIYIHTRSSLFLSSLLKRARAAARNRKKI